jgi:hypothetical protein
MSRVRGFIARWDLPFAVVTVILYAATIPALIVVFPDVSNLAVSVFVLVGGFTSSVASLASLLRESNK